MMFSLRALDLVALGLLFRRGASVRLRRTGLVGVCLLVGWTFRPVSCSCIRPFFARCDPTLAYHAALRSDLKNLASQQEIYRSDQGTFSSDPAALAFVASQGVEFLIEASADTWSARATHRSLGEGAACRMLVDLRTSESAAIVCGG